MHNTDTKLSNRTTIIFPTGYPLKDNLSINSKSIFSDTKRINKFSTVVFVNRLLSTGNSFATSKMNKLLKREMIVYKDELSSRLINAEGTPIDISRTN